MRNIKIKEVFVQKEIFTTKFSCDYENCKGACCWENTGEVLDGATLTSKEYDEIIASKDKISLQATDKEERDLISYSPVYKRLEDRFTNLTQDNHCVFCSLEKKSCLLKLAHKNGDLSFPIPISCHLYPLWIERTEDAIYLYLINTFEKFCESSYKKGEREGIYLIDFLKDAIIRNFDEAFFEELKRAQAQYL